VVGFYDNGNDASGSIKGGEFLVLLSDHWLLRNDCTMEFIGCDCI
jgi:hypothetical protein